MNKMSLADTMEQWRLASFRRRAELAWPAKAALALTMAAVTGLAAQVRVPLPFTPVPLTGQVFAVLLSGVLLGGAWGGLSQALYVGLGAAGVPWFSGWAGGLPLGPTAGYLLGFIPAAVLIGWLNDRFALVRSFVPQVAVMMVAVATIYVFGAAGFMLSTGLGFPTTLQMAVLPFIIGDIVKAIGAAAIASALLPSKDPGHRRDGRG